MSNTAQNVTIKNQTIEITRLNDGLKVSVKVPVDYVEDKVVQASNVSTASNENDDTTTSNKVINCTLISSGYFWDSFRDDNGDEYVSGYKWTFYSSLFVIFSYIAIAYLFFFNKKNEEEDEL